MTRSIAMIAIVVTAGLLAGHADRQAVPDIGVMWLAGEPPQAEGQPQADLPKQSIAEPGQRPEMVMELVAAAKPDAVDIASGDSRED